MLQEMQDRLQLLRIFVTPECLDTVHDRECLSQFSFSYAAISGRQCALTLLFDSEQQGQVRPTTTAPGPLIDFCSAYRATHKSPWSVVVCGSLVSGEW